MPESYTGDEGDDALAAGMDVMDGAEDRRDGWLAINKVRDYVAQYYNSAKSYADGLLAGISVAWGDITGKPSTFPPSTHTHTEISNGGNVLYWNGSDRWNSSGGFGAAGVIATNDHIYVPNATAATSGYAVAYINGDGRLCRNASSLKYKENVTDLDPASLTGLFDAQLREFEMKGGDGSRVIGYIAEEMDEIEDARRFVVRVHDEIDSIDFIQLLLAQVANLNARLELLEAGDGSTP